MPGKERLAQKESQGVRNSLRRLFRMIVPYNPPRPQSTAFPGELMRDWLTPQDIADLEDYYAELDAEDNAPIISDTTVVWTPGDKAGAALVNQAMLDLMSQPKF